MKLQVLALLAAASSLFLSGCETVDPNNPAGIPQRIIEQKPFTPAIRIVRNSVEPQTKLQYGPAFDQFRHCKPNTKLWEELEPTRVEFSCDLKIGGIIQYFWKVDPAAKKADIESITFTSMADAEFAGIYLNRMQAQEVLEKTMLDRQPIEE